MARLEFALSPPATNRAPTTRSLPPPATLRSRHHPRALRKIRGISNVGDILDLKLIAGSIRYIFSKKELAQLTLN